MLIVLDFKSPRRRKGHMATFLPFTGGGPQLSRVEPPTFRKLLETVILYRFVKQKLIFATYAKKYVPDITDLLRYWAMIVFFVGKAEVDILKVCEILFKSINNISATKQIVYELYVVCLSPFLLRLQKFIVHS